MARTEIAAPDLRPARAIVDIGSNTVRLVIYGGPLRAPVVLLNEKITARLGKGVAETGRLSEKAARMALAALARYRLLIDLSGVTDVDTVATAAVRDAADGGGFLERVREIGLHPRLLSGEEEAVTSARGVIGAFPDASGVVADLGGGSLELVDVADGQCSHGVSLKLGTLRLPALRADGDAKFAANVRAQMKQAGWQAEPGVTLYPVGGSLRSFARYAMRELDWPSDDPHGFTIEAGDAIRLARALARKRGDRLAPVPGVAAGRLAALPDAAALLQVVATRLKAQRLVFSSWGLREGLLFSRLSPPQQAESPLVAGVAAFVAHYGVSRASAERVARWTLCVEQLAGGGESDPRGKALRLAAVMLALAGANVEPNLRGDETMGWALRKRWIGIGLAERAGLAAALLANAGRLDLPVALRRYAPEEDLRRAQGWGLAVRLCRRFSGVAGIGAGSALAASELVAGPRELVLEVAPPLDALINEGVERDLRAIGQHLGVKTGWRRLAADELLHLGNNAVES